MSHEEIDLLVRKVKKYVTSRWHLGDLHGVRHWENVERYGLALSQYTGADPLVVRLFAYLHDACRQNEFIDPCHGTFAAQLVEQLRDSLLKDIPQTSYLQLKEACEGHTMILRTNNITVDTCFDADRLDLTRIGINLEPERMATPEGRSFAEAIETFRAARRARWE